MRVPLSLVNAFKTDFEPSLVDFLMKNEMIPERDALHQRRYLTRSVAPHVKALSDLFNRKDVTKSDTIDTETYWTDSANPKNRRLAYFLSFMPCNLFRVASVWGELHRLGFKWPFPADADFKGIEWGAGVASGACGIMAGEKYAPLGLPASGSFALIEQSKPALTLGTKWFEHYTSYSARPFHRRLELTQTWLPKAAPKFHLFVMSYFLNESSDTPEAMMERFIETCEMHLEEEGLVVIVEPALRVQSRKLLNFRKALIENPRVVRGEVPLKVLLPCLGHQACGALAREDDWCHEEVSWWRPHYLRELDALTGLDRKSLPFSYLVIQKTKKSLNEVLPKLQGVAEERYRLVSPAHDLSKRTAEFYICGQDGKRRSRYAAGEDGPEGEIGKSGFRRKFELERGDILQNATLHGEHSLTQIDRADVLYEAEKTVPSPEDTTGETVGETPAEKSGREPDFAE